MSDSATVKERDFTPVLIEDEVQRSYLDYAMSVIVARALPDVRDGLKPVQRRILYAMREAGYTADKPYRKSARIVGDVMGKYHPHGGEAIYDTMVRMAQPFSMRLVLIDGQGNFGSMDGDPPAAMRYTEARLARAASPLLDDIDADTVDFHDNYDGSAREPDVLPAAYPNLLINGAGGIAVGMATTIPPHNPGEALDAACALLDDPDLPDEKLRECLPGPDFPTGGMILGQAGIDGIFAGGRGILRVRARAAIENLEEASPRRKPPAIIVSEIPYQVNKSRLIERIAAVARDKSAEGIADLRDESDRQGLRIVIEVKRGFSATVLLNQLYRLTPLQISVGVNLLALRQGRPCVLTIRQVLEAFIAFREEVVTRRTLHKLEKTRARAHTLAGLGIAVAHLDEVISLIRNAADTQAARVALCGRNWQADAMAPFIRLLDEPGHGLGEDGAYTLSQPQAQAILELRLHRLTALERDKILDDLQAAMDDIKACLAILSDRAKLRAVLKSEMRALRSLFTSPRRTEIVAAGEALDDEDLIQSENVVMTLSRAGYVKCSPRTAFRTQQRGGRGRSGMNTREQDVVTRVSYANTHTTLLFFTSHGKVYQIKAYRLPQAAPNARGRPLINILPLRHGESASAIMPLPKDALTPQREKEKELFVMLATSGGNVRRNRLADFANLPNAGKIAMKLTKGESLIAAADAREKDDVVLVTRKGRAIRFAVSEVRVFSGRESTGVRGMGLDEGDEVMTMAILRHTDFTLGEREAWLKRVTGASSREEEQSAPTEQAEEATELNEAQARAMEQEEEFLFTVTSKGYGKRASAYDYRITGRGGKGIAHIALNRNDKVAACFAVRRRDDIILATDRGYTIRCAADAISLLRRPARGVRVVSLEEGDCVVSATPLIATDET